MIAAFRRGGVGLRGKRGAPTSVLVGPESR
jgi:hypothetical protein